MECALLHHVLYTIVSAYFIDSTIMSHIPRKNHFPDIDPVSLEHSTHTATHLKQLIGQQGSIPFQVWMHEALYAPGLGYYASGNTKLGNYQNQAITQGLPGDFTTAPELSPWFARTLSRQIKQV